MTKDLNIVCRASWNWSNKGAARIKWRIRVASECLLSHNARYIAIKSYYDIDYLVLIHYEDEICKQGSEAGGDELIHSYKHMHGFVSHVHSKPLWRHYDCSVTKSTQIWTQLCVNVLNSSFYELCVLVLNKINDNSNTNSAKFCKKLFSEWLRRMVKMTS